MPKYTVALSKKAKKQLDKLNDQTAMPILEAIARLETNPRPHGYIKLKNRDGYRIRIGDFRVIYEIFDKMLVVDIVEVGNRKEIYN